MVLTSSMYPNNQNKINVLKLYIQTRQPDKCKKHILSEFDLIINELATKNETVLYVENQTPR